MGARRVTADLRLRPTFLVIGAQRSGTTSLHDHLAEHPAVLPAKVKEIQYFHRYYEKGDRWYRARFPVTARASRVRRRIGAEPAVGETSPDYLFDPRAPARVHAFGPALKLIAILRDPVERAHSHWRMECRRGREELSFEEALDREERQLDAELALLAETTGYRELPFRISYAARGRYAEQLEGWLELFPREQLLVLTTQELEASPAEMMSRVSRFLEIPEWRSGSYRIRGAQGEAEIPPGARERLARAFEQHNRRLEELLGRSLDWTRPAAEDPRAGSRTSAAMRAGS